MKYVPIRKVMWIVIGSFPISIISIISVILLSSFLERAGLHIERADLILFFIIVGVCLVWVLLSLFAIVSAIVYLWRLHKKELDGQRLPGIVTLCFGVAWILFIYLSYLPPTHGGSPTTKTRAYLINLINASQDYFEDYGQWPGNTMALTNNPRKTVYYNMPDPSYLLDAWGHPIIYEPYDEKRGYGRIISLGRDGKPGGKGENADIEMRFPSAVSNRSTTPRPPN